MAIFGNFHELTPAEALTVLGRATGTMFVRVDELETMEIHVRSGRVIAVTLGGRAVADSLELQGVMTDLVRRREGTFEFRRRSLEGQVGSAPGFDVPLAQLVMNGLGFVDGVRECQDTLPSPKTVFELQRMPTIWLGESLQPFFESVEAALRDGASAEELSIITRIPADQVCWFLYNLRLAGVIQVRRCAAPATPRHRPAPIAASPATAEFAGRGDADLRHIRVARPTRTFISRLLGGLTSLLRHSTATF